MNKNIHEIHRNMWFKTTFILQLHMECVCEIPAELDGRLGAEWGCLQLPSPCDRDSTQGWPSTQFLPLFEQIQLGSSHTSWAGCKSPKEVLLECQCPHLWLKSHPALAAIELGTYKPNVAPFICFSRYLQQFLLNKALILHSISFFSHVLGHSGPNQPSRAT